MKNFLSYGGGVGEAPNAAFSPGDRIIVTVPVVYLDTVLYIQVNCKNFSKMKRLVHSKTSVK